MSNRFRFPRLHRTDLLLPAATLFSYPLALTLPPAWGMENGPIENAQLAVLLLGCAAALRAWRGQRGSPPGLLALGSVPVWLILAGRELSWGGALLQGDSTLWYQSAVAPAICAALAWSLLLLWRRRIGGFLLQLVRKGHRALLPLLLAMAASSFSACAEGHATCGLHVDALHAEVWEELLELIAYMALMHMQFLMLQGCRVYVDTADRAARKQRDAVG